MQKRIDDLMKNNFWIASYQETPEEKQKRISGREMIESCSVGELITVWPHWSDESFKVLVIENQSQKGVTCLVNGELKVVIPADFFFDNETPRKEIDVMGWVNSFTTSTMTKTIITPKPKKLVGKWTAVYEDFEKKCILQEQNCEH
jgi:hypothetical protein